MMARAVNAAKMHIKKRVENVFNKIKNTAEKKAHVVNDEKC